MTDRSAALVPDSPLRPASFQQALGQHMRSLVSLWFGMNATPPQDPEESWAPNSFPTVPGFTFSSPATYAGDFLFKKWGTDFPIFI